MDPLQSSGFDPHVQNQLQQLSQRASGYRESRPFRGQHRGRRDHFQGYDASNSTIGPHSAQSGTSHTQAALPPTPDSFPPLGSPPEQIVAEHSGYEAHQTAQNAMHLNYRNQSAYADTEVWTGRGRGRMRGRGRASRMYLPPTDTQVSVPTYQTTAEYRRGRGSYNNRMYFSGPNNRPLPPEAARAERMRAMDQCDYLNTMAAISLTNRIPIEELHEKQSFCRNLESLARGVMAKTKGTDVSGILNIVQLEPYGSVVNGFGTIGCDMDLMFTSKAEDGSYEAVDEETKRALERAVLDAGFGARLLTNTRIPILRVCSAPDIELLQNLREHRLKWEQNLNPNDEGVSDNDRFSLPPKLTAEQQDRAATAEFDDSALEIPLPASPLPDNLKLEFTGNCGIQCDINFTNHVALVNTRMLWTYAQCDQRVQEMGIFVKNWAKARDINTPYRGTLSSYGYVLMVLHFLMNIATPPVIPNLQQLARENDGWTQQAAEMFEGSDVSFLQDYVKAQEYLHIQYRKKNNQTLGGLLREFFQYYALPTGFNWMKEIISIRTPGGIVTKAAKGWTEAKWAQSKTNVRLRYLVAIEDPFEVEHNIARTVGHSGIIAIRDEFRRAWRIIDGIQRGPQPGQWIWNRSEKNETSDGAELLMVAEPRGDLLKRDNDERKQKLRRLREEVEAREEEMKHLHLDDTNEHEVEHESTTTSGTLREYFSKNEPLKSPSRESKLVLIGDHQQRDLKRISMKHRVREIRRQEPGWDYDAEEPCSKSNFCGKDPGSGCVGRIIPWTTHSVAGRWLLNRDYHIRKGNWKRPTFRDKVALNARFPYDPSMTQAQLNAKNELLQRYYVTSYYPRIEAEVGTNGHICSSKVDQNCNFEEEGNYLCATNCSSCLEDATCDSVAFRCPKKNYQRENQSAIRLHGLSGSKDIEVGAQIPWSASNDVGRWLLWRDRKLARDLWDHSVRPTFPLSMIDQLSPYDPKMLLSDLEMYNAEIDRYFHNVSLPRTGMLKEEASHWNSAMMKAIQDLSNGRSLTYRCKSDDNRCISIRTDGFQDNDTDEKSMCRTINFHMLTTGEKGKTNRQDWVKRDSTSSTFSKTDYKSHKDEPIGWERSRYSFDQRSNDRLDVLNAIEAETRSKTCHFPQDTQTMPVPNTPHFQFDIRQMIDLKIIEAGGNGCAKSGHEWAIEEKRGSWGGGGAMAQRKEIFDD